MAGQSYLGRRATRRLFGVVLVSFVLMSLPIYLTVSEAYRLLRFEKGAEYSLMASDAHRAIVLNFQELLMRERYRPPSHYDLARDLPLMRSDLERELPGVLLCFQHSSQQPLSLLPPKMPVDAPTSDDSRAKTIQRAQSLAETVAERSTVIVPAETLYIDRTSDLLALYRVVSVETRPVLQGCVVHEREFFAHMMEGPFLSAPASERLVAKVKHDGLPLDSFQRLPPSALERYEGGERITIKTESLPKPFDHYSVDYTAVKIRLSTGGTALRAQVFLYLLFVPLMFYLLYWVGSWAIALGEERARFAAVIGHELRTPLASLKLHLEMLRDGIVTGPEKTREYHERLLSQVDRLVRLAGGSLALAGYASSRERGALAPQSLSDLIVECELAAREGAHQFDLKLEYVCAVSDTNRTVNVHGDLVRTLFDNACDNASKFSLGRRDLAVTVRSVGERVIVTIRDFGPGMSKRDIRRIFEPFFRGRRAFTEQVGGIGLGLSIVRTMVLASEGSITARNRDPGFELEVSLPCSRP